MGLLIVINGVMLESAAKLPSGAWVALGVALACMVLFLIYLSYRPRRRCRHDWETLIEWGARRHQRCRRCGKDRRALTWEARRQVAIAALGLPALVGVMAGGPWAWWGSLLGLLSQPAWLRSTWRARQWGMFGLSLGYCFAWGLGLWLQG